VEVAAHVNPNDANLVRDQKRSNAASEIAASGEHEVPLIRGGDHRAVSFESDGVAMTSTRRGHPGTSFW